MQNLLQVSKQLSAEEVVVALIKAFHAISKSTDADQLIAFWRTMDFLEPSLTSADKQRMKAVRRVILDQVREVAFERSIGLCDELKHF